MPPEMKVKLLDWQGEVIGEMYCCFIEIESQDTYLGRFRLDTTMTPDNKKLTARVESLN